jgi:hypothetical protein
MSEVETKSTPVVPCNIDCQQQPPICFKQLQLGQQEQEGAKGSPLWRRLLAGVKPAGFRVQNLTRHTEFKV